MLQIFNSEIYFSEKPSSLVTGSFAALQWDDSSPYFCDLYDITSAQFTLSLPKRCEPREKAFYDVLAKKTRRRLG